MKKYLVLFLLITSVVLFGCSDRNSPSSPSSTTKYGYIQVVNNSSSPYSINIKGNTHLTFTLNGEQSITKKVETGYYNVHIKQISGYILYPTEKDYEFYVNEDKTSLISFTTTL